MPFTAQKRQRQSGQEARRPPAATGGWLLLGCAAAGPGPAELAAAFLGCSAASPGPAELAAAFFGCSAFTAGALAAALASLPACREGWGCFGSPAATLTGTAASELAAAGAGFACEASAA